MGDLAVRSMLQNRVADVCIDMCKDVGAFPEKCTCPDYTDTTDKTPNLMTWPELLDYLSKQKLNGRAAIKDWKGISFLQRGHTFRIEEVSKACLAEDLKHRMAVQNMLQGVCEDMCKDVGAYPKCTCPGYTDTTDKSPGVLDWEELL